MQKKLWSQVIYIQGIHCAACEILIRSILEESALVKKFELSTKENKVEVWFSDERMAEGEVALYFMRQLFKETEYTFSIEEKKTLRWMDVVLGVGLAGGVLLIVSLLNQQNIIAEPKLDTSSGYMAIFVFGFLASISSCAALVGGIVLSLAQTWFKSGQAKWLPIVSFQVGRVVGFGIGGLILGMIGTFFQMDYMLNAILLMIVAIAMILAGLDFMGVKIWRKLFKGNKLHKLAENEKAEKWWWPAMVGAATFFIPCGFTSTAQLLALATEEPVRAAGVMVWFVLGTVPVLSLIAYSGSLWQGKKRINQIITYAIGALIICLGLMNVNSQLRALGLPNWEGMSAVSAVSGENKKPGETAQDGLVPMEGEVQVIRLTADAVGYKPASIKIRANTLTRLEVEDKGTRGCTNAMIAPDFWEGRLELENGETAIKEFMTGAAGKYRMTCWMRMAVVNVEVVE